MKRNISVGVIGAGNIALKHLEVVKKIKNFKIKAITSRTLSKAKKLAKTFKIEKINENIEDLLKKNHIDCLLIFVSAENMYSTIKKIINFKVPFFFEKPAGLNYRETKELSDLCYQNKIRNMVGLNRRFYSIFEEGKKIIKKRGRFKGILIEGHERIWLINKRKKNKKVLNNWIYANSIHTIDLLRYFGGEIKKIKGFSNNYGSEKNISFSVKFKNNSIGTYISNWNSPAGWSITIFGDGYTLSYKPLENGRLITSNFKEKKLNKSVFDKRFKPGFYKQMNCFKNLIINRKLKEPAQDLKQYLKSVSIAKTFNK